MPLHLKWLLGGLLVAITLLLGNRFLAADFFINSETNTFAEHLKQKDKTFFESRLPNTESKDLFLKTLEGYEKVIDPKVEKWSHTTFLSFLGLKKDSSRLYSHFGILSEELGEYTFWFDKPLLASIVKSDNQSITIQNTSPIAYPLTGKILIVPSDIPGTALFDGKFLPAGETATIRFTSAIPKEYQFLESVEYGFRVKLEANKQ